MKFPSIAAVAAELRDINTVEITDPDPDASIDVRLQVYPDGTWAVRSGDASYDTDHNGHWGASSVPGNGRRFNSVDVARELIDQCRDDHAQAVACESVISGK